jgi:ectoine hydrolase
MSHPTWKAPMSAFESAEYLERLRRTQSAMAQRGIDLLFVTTPENINYLSGYEGWSFYTCQGLIVTQDVRQPMLVLREMDVACARFTAYMDAPNIVGYPEEYIGGDKHPMTFITTLIRERWPAIRTIGVERGGFFFPVADYDRLQAGMGEKTFADATGLVNWLRTTKSAAEIAVMREAGRIASNAVAVAQEKIEPGVRECDVAAEIFRTLIRGEPQFGGTPPCEMSLTAGGKTSAPHLCWSEDRFQQGTGVNLELGGSRHHYHAGLARSFYLGTPPEPLVRLSRVVIDGMHAALAAVRPGRTCEEVEAAWRQSITREGFEKKSRIGYAIGIGFRPTWLECTASLQAGDRTVLQPGMTFHMICGMWHGTHNFVASETLAVTADGHELLTRMPQGLLVRS